MSEINGSEYKESHFPAGEVVWSALGIIVVLAFGDLFVLLALAAAVAISGHRLVDVPEHRASRTEHQRRRLGLRD